MTWHPPAEAIEALERIDDGRTLLVPVRVSVELAEDILTGWTRCRRFRFLWSDWPAPGGAWTILVDDSGATPGRPC